MIIECKKKVPTTLTSSFTSVEFDCHCGHPNCQITYIDLELVNKLQRKRAEIKLPIIIVSGFRCAAHNRSVDGKPGSLHLVGKAADIRVEGMSHAALQAYMQDFDGLGCGILKTHVDIRGYKARWRYK